MSRVSAVSEPMCGLLVCGSVECGVRVACYARLYRSTHHALDIDATASVVHD